MPLSPTLRTQAVHWDMVGHHMMSLRLPDCLFGRRGGEKVVGERKRKDKGGRGLESEGA